VKPKVIQQLLRQVFTVDNRTKARHRMQQKQIKQRELVQEQQNEGHQQIIVVLGYL